jgi:GTP-binding protein
MSERVSNEKIRNIAIIAHVDHGKTTLVDAMFQQSGVFRQGQNVDDRIMDSMDLERERGITISAKNCSVIFDDVKINILDTPGHADFGAEVERALSMVDGAILLVDASEGPLPQTRFVLKKAFEAGHKIIVIINKIDRADARTDEVLDEIYDLFIDLDATDEQMDFLVLYAIGRDGIVKKDINDKVDNLNILFSTILEEMPPPSYDPDEPFQMLISDLGHSDYIGRLAIGKIVNGKVTSQDNLIVVGKEKQSRVRVSKLQVYNGMELGDVSTVDPGDIAVVSGTEDFEIGDTICTVDFPKALPGIIVDEPTVSMKFTITDSPFSGKEGKKVQSRIIRERLQKESLINVAISFDETDQKDCFIVKGRGEFQMAILVETMRREGFELCVGRPEVILKYKDGQKLEPIEKLYVDCDETYLGVVTEKLSMKKGKLLNLINNNKGRVNMEFSIPSRALIGYRDEFLTDTRGTGIMNSLFSGYDKYRGDYPVRHTGSLIADRQGKGVAYGLFNLEPRGRLFIRPGDPVYEGMVIGEHNKEQDLYVNPCKEKKLTNMRASGKDESTVCTNVKQMTLEFALNFIQNNELVEVTPKSIRLRKILLPKQKEYINRTKKSE